MKEQEQRPQRIRGPRDQEPASKESSDAGGPPGQGGLPAGEGAVPRIRTTALAVEYINKTENAEAALKALDERAGSLESRINSFKAGQDGLLTASNQRFKVIREFVTSVGQRIEEMQKNLLTGIAQPREAEAAEATATPETVEAGVPERYASDASHKEAWSTARIVVAELAALYPNEVTEGVLNGNFHEVLSREIGEARKVYEGGVEQSVLQEHDYVSAALAALVARKQQELKNGRSS